MHPLHREWTGVSDLAAALILTAEATTAWRGVQQKARVLRTAVELLRAVLSGRVAETLGEQDLGPKALKLAVRIPTARNPLREWRRKITDLLLSERALPWSFPRDAERDGPALLTLSPDAGRVLRIVAGMMRYSRGIERPATAGLALPRGGWWT